MCSREKLVGTQGFEPWMKEPKSLVLPLHHIPIYILHTNSIYIRQRYYQRRRPSTPTKAMLKSFFYNHELNEYKAL